MDKSFLKPNERYLFRLNGRQVPVIYNGWGLWGGHPEQGRNMHAFTRLDDGQQFFRKSALGVSKHYDDCPVNEFQAAACNCRAWLEAIRHG